MVDLSFTIDDFMRDRHAELALYVIVLQLNANYPAEQYGNEAGRELLRQHFLYWWALEEQGLLIGAGPVSPGEANQSGMAIVRARCRDHAEQLASDEPFHRAGWRTNSVQPWQLNEGLAVKLIASLPALA